MANIDRPNGAKPVKTLSGRPYEGTMRYIGVADGTDIFKGDLITLTSGLGAFAATNDATILGIAQGFGKFSADGAPEGPFDPDNLSPGFYNDAASTHTEWYVAYVPVDDLVFEMQTGTADSLVVGETIDFVTGTGSSTTGVSVTEINGGTATNADMTVVEIPVTQDNDPTLVWGRYWLMVTRAEQAFH